MAGKTSTKSKASKAKEAEAPEAVEEELDEVSGDEAEATETKGKKADDVVFGASDLAKLLSEKSGKTVTTRELRTLIRKMARDGQGRVNREIVPGNRSRYSWSGPKDPEVKAIIAAFEGGELEQDKQEKLAQLKENKAKKKAEKDKAEGGKKGKKGSKKADAEPAAEASDDDELELDD